MTRDELITDTSETVTLLNNKVRETVTMGKPGEACDYARALADAATAYSYLDTTEDD